MLPNKHLSSKQIQARSSAVCTKQQIVYYWMAGLFLNISVLDETVNRQIAIMVNNF